jgi:hypothetical protein
MEVNDGVVELTLLAFNIEKKSKKMCCLELFPFILKEI